MNNIYGYNEQNPALPPHEEHPMRLKNEPISDSLGRLIRHEETTHIDGSISTEMWYETEPEQDWLWLAGINEIL